MKLEAFKQDELEYYIEFATEFHDGPGSCTPSNPVIFKKNFEHILNSDEAYGFFLIEDDQRIGYVLCSKMFSTEIGEYAIWVEELSILENYQGRGFGSETFELLETKFENVKRVRLEIAPTNDDAKRLYERLGYSFSPYGQMYKNV